MKFQDTIDEIFKDVKFNKRWVEQNQKELDQGCTLILEVNKFLESNLLIQSQKLYIKTDSIFETLISAMFCRGFKTYQCIITNLWNGYLIEAENLSRSLFELLVNILFISQKQRVRRVKRFFDYKFIEDIVLMKGFDKHLTKLYSKMKKIDSGKTWQEYEQSFRSKKRKFLYRKPNGKRVLLRQWSKENFGTKCDLVGLTGYKSIIYHLYSSAEHAGPSSVLSSIAEINGNHRYFQFSPGYEKVEHTITESAKFFTLIFYIFASVFNLSLTGTLAEGYRLLKNHDDFKECFNKNRILRLVKI